MRVGSHVHTINLMREYSKNLKKINTEKKKKEKKMGTETFNTNVIFYSYEVKLTSL